MSTAECCSNPPRLSSSSGDGIIENIGGLNTYVTNSNSNPNSNRAIILISDVFGYEAPNLRKLADKVAASGFLVLLPDFLYGDYLKLDPDFDRQAWLKKHTTDQGCEDAKTLITALRSRGVTSIGAAGFCWGGVVVVKLAKSADYIQAGVVLHPGPLTDNDINEVKIPISILGAEIDHTCPPEQARHFEKILAAKSEIESFVKIYPGVSHGWSVRYDVEDDSAVKSAEESHSDMLNWFIKHIK
ncbi:endo-1,3;1,4-beta-D-glucanase-like [Silene latifolia]|uniref:endo-1,3;1,4-beta-D-glucanase-like n=1 Tax=Silene latifolia TaxID=37657 RepID=UPI003D76DE11